jgi:hypothetical protein
MDQSMRNEAIRSPAIAFAFESLLIFFSLKTKQQRQQSTFDEQFKALQGMRSNLVARKGILENQIQDLDARMLEKQQKGTNAENKEQPGGGR